MPINNINTYYNYCDINKKLFNNLNFNKKSLNIPFNFKCDENTFLNSYKLHEYYLNYYRNIYTINQFIEENDCYFILDKNNIYIDNNINNCNYNYDYIL